MWLGQAVLAGAKSLTLLLFSSSEEDEGEDFSNTWIVQDMDIFKEMALQWLEPWPQASRNRVTVGKCSPVLLTPFPKILHYSLGSSSVSSALWLLLNFTEQQKTSYAASLSYEI